MELRISLRPSGPGFVALCRLLVTYRISVSALAITEIRRLQIAKTKQRDGSGPGARGRLGGPR